jgi:hypothetical protein
MTTRAYILCLFLTAITGVVTFDLVAGNSNVGINLMHANGFNIDLQYSKDLRTFENKDDVGQIQLQFRFRF